VGPAALQPFGKAGWRRGKRLPAINWANLPARLFEDYDHVSFLVSGLYIPVGFGDLSQ